MANRPRSGRLIGAGKYELVSPIGTGAMGTVWLGRHLALDRVVAVKTLNMGGDSSSEARQRFLSEARAASLLRHANSVRVLDYGADTDECWLVMEFLEGRTLAELLAEQSPLAPRRALSIAVQILAAMAEAHDFGIVHRDLKPSNIMLVPWVDDEGRETEQVKVLDFGIAQLAAPGAVHSEVAGTPEYMSPEQTQGLGLDPRSDVYAVGVVLYQMLTGEVPLHGENAIDTMMAHINKAPRPARERSPAVSPRLDAVIMRALAKHPAERYAGARALRTALLDMPEAAGLRGDSAPRMRPVTSPGVPRPHVIAPPALTAPSKRRAWWPLALLVALLGVGAALAVFLMNRAPETPVAQREQARALPPVALPAHAPIGLVDTALPPAPEVESAVVEADGGPEPDLALAMLAPETGPVAVVEARPEPNEPNGPKEPKERKEPRVAKEEARAPDGSHAPREPDASNDPSSTKVPPRDAETPAPDARLAAPQVPDPEPHRAAAPGTEPDGAAPAAKLEPKKEPPEPKLEPALSARVVVRDLVVKGALPRSAVQRLLDATLPALEECYRASAEAARHDSGGSLHGSMVIDVDGRATLVDVGSFSLVGFSTCARAALARARSRERPDTGTALASFVLAVTPKPPRAPEMAP